MTDEPTHRLSHEQMLALTFAAHRQLARWARRRDLPPLQHAERAALIAAVDVLEDRALAHGCELRPVDDS